MWYTNILNKNLITFSINEFRTSIIHNKLEKQCENHKYKYDYKKESIKSIYLLERIKKVNIEKYNTIIKTKKVHKVLICKTNEKLSDLFVNRDNNSILNMKKIVLSYISINQRHRDAPQGSPTRWQPCFAEASRCTFGDLKRLFMVQQLAGLSAIVVYVRVE